MRSRSPRKMIRGPGRPGAILAVLGAAVALALFACVAEQERRPEPEPVRELAGEPVVRVLLVENARAIKIGAEGPCQVVPAVGAPLLVDRLPDQTLLPGDGSGIVLGERRFPGAQECRIVPSGAGAVRLEGKPYRGELVVRVDRGALRVVNHVHLEDYTAGVVGGEMPLNWPDAAVKAQSIAARTYAVWHFLHGKSDDHDLTADTRSQVYTGAASDRAKSVVRATEGRVLTWGRRVFEAYFMSTCSGETADAGWVFGVASIPPLEGTPCGMCTPSKRALWTKEVPAPDLAKALAPFGVKAPVTRVETVGFPRGGYVREVVVRHAGGETTIEGAKVRKALDLFSAAFEVAPGAGGNSLLVTGRGWGHGVGMCQWGAKGCAEVGMDEDAILKKYYPGAEILKVY